MLVGVFCSADVSMERGKSCAAFGVPDTPSTTRSALILTVSWYGAHEQRLAHAALRRWRLLLLLLLLSLCETAMAVPMCPLLKSLTS
jgi:hypothetical protein